MHIKGKTTPQQFENALNKLVDYVVWFDQEYHKKSKHSDFEKGQHLAYFTVLDTVKNQLIDYGVQIDEDLETICNQLLQ